MALPIQILEQSFITDSLGLMLGYGQGISPYTTTPMMIKAAAQIPRLKFSPFCNHNLVTYLLGLQKVVSQAIGVLVKPCDGKTLIELIRENKIGRERIKIFSLPCQGQIDRNKLFRLKKRETEAITKVEVTGEAVSVHFKERLVEVPLADLVENKCLRCQLKSAPIYDYLLGEANPPKLKELPSPKSFKTAEAARSFWLKEYDRCLRCGACRNVCPLCYCPNCILERAIPQMIRKEVTPAENGAFLMIRALHLAGRCVDCGRCADVCPVNIYHEGFHLPVAEYILKTFDYKTGQDIDKKSLYAEAKKEEKEDFPPVK